MEGNGGHWAEPKRSFKLVINLVSNQSNPAVKARAGKIVLKRTSAKGFSPARERLQILVL